VTIFEDPFQLQQQALAWRQAGDEIGLVPTMGALHAGHDSLVSRACRENARVIVSVFVNPLQFGPEEDFASYPRPFERDAERLKTLNVDAVLHPGVDQLFPSSFKSAVDPGPLGELLEGRARPGHFRGVLTVVLKLLELAQPKRAYFGQKDIQQLLLVRQLTRDFAIPVRIVGCPTVREADGLALSSRNAYLSAEERAKAPVIFRALRVAEAAFGAGQTDPERLERAAFEVLAAQPGLVVDYLACCDELTLQRPAQAAAGNILATAVKLGSTRLIDNVVLGAGSD
jgi:pantoate--beta-alanine ligase